MSNIKIGDKVKLNLRDVHRTRVVGTVTDVYDKGDKLSISLSHHYKCWSYTKDVAKIR